jgi:tripartite-type tricarboxylate transporter receptor subunit TctC
VIPINKPAAGGVEAADYVAKARKDGYTLLFCAAPAVVHIPVTSPETVPYDAARDFEPIARAVSFPFVIAVKSDSPWKSLKELVEYAKKSPDKARMGVAGTGTVSHFNLAILNSAAGVNMTAVPYKGAAPAVTAVLGGHIEGNSLALGANLAQMNAGRLRALVISSKSPQAAQIPSPAEAGYPQMKLLGVWVGAFAPAGTPNHAVNSLVSAFEKAIRSTEVSQMAEGIGVSVDYLSPDQLRKSMKEETELIRDIAKRAGLRKN